jgi:hypothetical protein
MVNGGRISGNWAAFLQELIAVGPLFVGLSGIAIANLTDVVLVGVLQRLKPGIHCGV